jgi:iron-sulfur cluster assembly protein
MLVLTEATAEAVKSVISNPQVPGGEGLRIAPSAPESRRPAGFQLTAALVPAEDDQVIEAACVRVFVEPQAAAHLADKVLDAQVDEQGLARFFLGVQEPGQA